MTPYYDDGTCVIYHGDCRDVLPHIETVDLLVTDPPYGQAWNSGRGRMGAIAGDDGGLDVEACLKAALRCLRSKRHAYVFGPYDLTQFTVGATADLVWDKGGLSSGDLSIPWGPTHERIAFAVWTPYPSEKGAGGLAARLRRGSVLHVPRQNNGRGALTHPTEKPVMLLRQLIEASSLHGDVVLDPFLGSGSTVVAARTEGRRAVGIEIEERYCEIAAKRLAQEVLDFGGAA
jgi:DNA modification methylase